VSEFTDEQREAWQRVNDWYPSAAKVLGPLLPDGLTTPPPPPLPTEPGTTIYGGRDQPRTMFRLTLGGGPRRHWVDEHGDRYTDEEARDLMGEWETTPPTVAPEPITEAQVRAALQKNRADTPTSLAMSVILDVANRKITS